MGKDIKGYYVVLEIDQNSTNDEIKKAYRNLARVHHPDRGGDEAKFKEIQEAYDILSDDDKKRMYDSDIDFDQHQQQQHDENFTVFDLSDILKNVFNVQEVPHNRNEKVVHIDLSIDDVVYGCVKMVKYTQHAKCSKCDENGTTHTGLIHCFRCNGQGYLPTFPMPTVCPSCNGDSIIRQNVQKCKACNLGYIEEVFEAEVKLKSGVKHNEQLSITNDLSVVIQHVFEKSYKIKNDNIHLRCIITLEEAIIGTNKLITITSKESITLKSGKYIDNTEPFVVKGKGVLKDDHSRGDCIIHFVIVGSKCADKFIKYRKAFLKIFS